MKKIIAFFLLSVLFMGVLTACEGFNLPLPNTDTYTVSFNTHGGTPLSSLKVDKNTTTNLPVATREGFTFLAWYQESSYITIFTSEAIVDRDMTLHAKWEVNTYTIVFDSRGGTAIDTLNLTFGDPIALPEPPFKAEAEFGGWYLDAMLLVPFTATSMPAEHLTLYARWISETEDPYDFLASIPSSTITSFEAFVNYFDYLLFNRMTEATITVAYDFEDLNEEINKAFAAKHIQSNVSLSFSWQSGTGTLNIQATYSAEAIESASNDDVYLQRPFYRSLVVSSRDSSFNAFKLYDIERTYPVETSDQLYFVMEKGYRPVFVTEGTIAEAMYEAAKEVLRDIIDDSMTDIEKLEAIYFWLVQEVTYDGALLDKLMQGEPNLNRFNGFYLEGVFLDGRAVCDGFSKAFLVMARLEGIEAIRIIGKPADPTNTVLHAWNKVKLGETWYVIDTTSANLILNQLTELFSYAFFLIDDDRMETRYIATSNLDVVATGYYNVYANRAIEYNTQVISRSINSQEELNTLFDYYVSLGSPTMSIDVLINFDYGEQFTDAIQQALQASALNTLAYAFVDDVFIFWQTTSLD